MSNEEIPAFAVYNKPQPKLQKPKKRKKKAATGEDLIPRKMLKPQVNGNVEGVVEQKRKTLKPMKRVAKIKKRVPKCVIQEEKIQSVTQKAHIQPTAKDSFISDNPALDAVQLFKWMVAPISPEKFFTTYWESKVLHLKHTNKNYYTHILNCESLDKIIRNNNLHYTRNIDVVSYENGTKEEHNQEGRAVPNALWDFYSNGCSIRILNPQTYSNKIQLLLATLQEYFGCMVGANVYLTPPGSQGFAPHYDDIEAFILQLEGRKHWKLYKPKESDTLARYSSPNLNNTDIGQPFMELTLQAGEMLYFPRGTIHEGRTDDEAHSLHITVSVYQQTSFADLLQHIVPDALKRASESNVEFRKGLPLNYLKHFGIATNCKQSELRKSVEDSVKSLMHSLVEYIDVDGAADLLGKKFIHDSMPPVVGKYELGRTSRTDGAFLKDGQVIKRVNIDLGTRIRLLRYYCIRLVKENNSTKLYYNTENATVYHGEEQQWLELECCMIPAIQKLQNAYPSYLAVEELPMKEVVPKLQLVSALWERSLIVSEHPLKNVDDDS